ncbi:hypothetical protein HPB49_007035 [Dermacentor silvarum]|uniref:Uncharacterized protein n=1 Tax=Dermacentor silvarum TaxID=543639 RepID=A0ACB8CQ77_DERSI|nr:hypothetical protein HPB49_007035 [Dermacentor silvarum]
MDKYLQMRQLRINDQLHEVSVYETAPNLTTNAIIRAIPLVDDPKTIDGKIVNLRNPTALTAKRIGKSTTIIIAFDGLKVRTLIRSGETLLRCTLYRKQIDICHQCGRLGHRMDACPNPQAKCTPRCDLCGEAHPMAENTFKARFKTPYIVKRRRWERRMLAEEQVAMEAAATESTGPPRTEGLVKKAIFQQHVRKTQPKPDVILLHETAGSQASLPRYRDVLAPAPTDRG